MIQAKLESVKKSINLSVASVATEMKPLALQSEHRRKIQPKRTSHQIVWQVVVSKYFKMLAKGSFLWKQMKQADDKAAKSREDVFTPGTFAEDPVWSRSPAGQITQPHNTNFKAWLDTLEYLHSPVQLEAKSTTLLYKLLTHTQWSM